MLYNESGNEKGRIAEMKPFKCRYCGEPIKDIPGIPWTDSHCPNCGKTQPPEEWVKYNKETKAVVKNIKCPECGCETSYLTPEYPQYNIPAFAHCTECGKLTYEGPRKNPEPVNTIQFPPKPTVKCPYCGSTNTKKISFGTKAAHTALFGVFAVGKVSKEWHCNNCKSDF